MHLKGTAVKKKNKQTKKHLYR